MRNYNRRGRGNNKKSNGSYSKKSSNGRPFSPSQTQFDSNGPMGKVRGTANQVIEKYLNLANDAKLAGDYMLAESFFQYAEHYTTFIVEHSILEKAKAEQQEKHKKENEDNLDSQCESPEKQKIKTSEKRPQTKEAEQKIPKTMDIKKDKKDFEDKTIDSDSNLSPKQDSLLS